MIKVKHLYTKSFLIALAAAAAIFLPAIIYDWGYFIFLGDFNSQQIPFYMVAHNAVRSGEWGWNWYTDLGANFIGSYSFYLLGSPFFWLTIPFPAKVVPYLMGPLLILKFACAALFATIYMKRYVRNQYFALLGGLLYAFSGFSIYNIFFNHFHEAIVFFPLLLISLDELVENNTRGLFALSVCLNALISYFFFFGEVVFVLIYYFLRVGLKDYKRSLRTFFVIAFESVIGFLMSGVIMLPALISVLGNYRVNNFSSGFNLWLYTRNQRIPAIINAFLFPPEMPSMQILLPDASTKWTSLNAYLPLVSVSGVLAYLSARRSHWLSYIIRILFFMALVPGLNSLFVAMNASYYTRWFYMLTLMLSLATVMAMDHRMAGKLHRKSWVTLGVTLAIVLVLALTPQLKDGALERIGLYNADDWVYFIVIGATAVLSLLAFIFMIPTLRKSPKAFAKKAIIGVLIISVLYGNYFIFWGKSRSYDTKNYIIPDAIEGEAKITIPDKDQVLRIDADDSLINMGMFWKISCMRAFHSIVPSSIMEFYKYIGEKRDVSSKIPEEQYAVRGLLAVKYYFDRIGASDNFGDPASDPVETTMPGYSYYGTMAGYNVWENNYYVPMGFVYDEYMTKAELDTIDDSKKAALMLHAICLEEDRSLFYTDILQHLQDPKGYRVTRETYYEDCLNRRALTVRDLQRTKTGITCTSDFIKDRMVFFSIPYDDGWSCYIDGAKVHIEKANVGFMAIRVPQGNHEIEFVYRTPGLLYGLVATFAAIAAWVLYMLIHTEIEHHKEKKRRQIEKAEAAAPEDGLEERETAAADTEEAAEELEVEEADAPPEADGNELEGKEADAPPETEGVELEVEEADAPPETEGIELEVEEAQDD